MVKVGTRILVYNFTTLVVFATFTECPTVQNHDNKFTVSKVSTCK